MGPADARLGSNRTQGLGVAAFACPGALEAALRATNLFKATHIYPDDSGQVTGVAVINNGDIAIAYFPT